MAKRSKKEVEAIVSGMGVFTAIISRLAELVKELGGSIKNLYRLATPEGSETLKVVARVIVDAAKKITVPGRFFMTVTLGTYPTVADLRKTILSSGKKIGGYADQILEKIEISPEKVEVDLWEITGFELGFTEAVPRSAIYQRVFEIGFEQSSAEGIALSRIECVDKKLRIGGMAPIADSGGDLGLLYLSSYDGDLWLLTYYDGPGLLWDPGFVWLFVRPRR